MPSSDETNILAFLASDCIGNAASTVSDAATAQDEPREVTIDVAGRFRARITFRRFYFKRGKMSRWFWTAERAEKVG